MKRVVADLAHGEEEVRQEEKRTPGCAINTSLEHIKPNYKQISVRDLRTATEARGLLPDAAKPSKAQLADALASDDAKVFATRSKWTKIEDPLPYAHVVEVRSLERWEAQYPTIRAVVSQFPGSQDMLSIEVLGWDPEHDDGMIVEADVMVSHDAVNTVRDLRFEGTVLWYRIDSGFGDGEDRCVDVSDWGMFAKEVIRQKKPAKKKRD